MDSYSQDTVDAAVRGEAWRAAKACGPNGGNCVEVNLGARGLAGLRDSKSAAGSVLVFAGQEWSTFMVAAKSGQFDRR